jgi:hypothetical protein
MNTTDNQPTKRVTIPLSERGPISVDPARWHKVARVKDWDNQYESQANNVWTICVRIEGWPARMDRAVVYGSHDSGSGGEWAGFRATHGGFLIENADMPQIVRAIRRVAGIIGNDRLGDECIHELPAEEL